jgi:hypothetical protein
MCHQVILEILNTTWPIEPETLSHSTVKGVVEQICKCYLSPQLPVTLMAEERLQDGVVLELLQEWEDPEKGKGLFLF